MQTECIPTHTGGRQEMLNDHTKHIAQALGAAMSHVRVRM